MSSSFALTSGRHVLAVSGSLRAVSSNTTLLRVAAALAPEGVTVALSTDIGALPHFNPDLDGEAPPPAVVDWRTKLRQADGVLICSPEYAHGVPGSLKNALDWIVGSGELMQKPVALINVSLGSTHAQAALTETLSVMMADVRVFRVPLPSNKVDEAVLLANPELTQALREVLADLLNRQRDGSDSGMAAIETRGGCCVEVVGLDLGETPNSYRSRPLS